MDSDKAVYFAKIDLKTERYDNMIENMKYLADLKLVLSIEEQHLLWIAYKNCVSIRRNSLRRIKSFQIIEMTENESNPLTNEYKLLIENEIHKIAIEILTTLDEILIPCCTDIKSKVFYLKLRGDFNRYLAEISTDKDQKEFIANAAVSYKEGSELAISSLSPTDPLRLGLALNFGVFFYEILEMPERALQLLKGAYSDALILLDTVKEEEYQKLMVILQVIKDNIAMWLASQQHYN